MMSEQPARPTLRLGSGCTPQIKFLHRPTLQQEAAILAVMETMEAIAPGTSFDWYSSGLFNNSNPPEGDTQGYGLGEKPLERN